MSDPNTIGRSFQDQVGRLLNDLAARHSGRVKVVAQETITLYNGNTAAELLWRSPSDEQRSARDNREVAPGLAADPMAALGQQVNMVRIWQLDNQANRMAADPAEPTHLGQAIAEGGHAARLRSC